MIMSVSTLTMGSGAATPVSLVNFSMLISRSCFNHISGSVYTILAAASMRRQRRIPPPLSDDIELAIGAVRRDAIVMEHAAIYGLVAAMHNPFRKCPRGARGLLQAVTGKPVAEQEIRNVPVRPDDRVLVEGI